jgi:hypothetical protein
MQQIIEMKYKHEFSIIEKVKINIYGIRKIRDRFLAFADSECKGNSELYYSLSKGILFSIFKTLKAKFQEYIRIKI